MDAVYEKANFVGSYREETEEFYKRFFENEEELKEFLFLVFKNNEIDKKPRLLINRVKRFVSLAKEINILMPTRDMLVILFIRICIESMCNIICEKKKKATFFYDNISSKDEDFILTHIKLIIEDEHKITREVGLDSKGLDDIVYIIRNMVAHEGDYWNFQIFNNKEMNHISVLNPDEKKPIMGYMNQDYYSFEISQLTSNDFLDIFVRTCITFIKKYMSNVN
ncbi:hypothetical protein [Aminipila sp.]|uniref:hypothetical protein n=1 Tax=Aminipila sp. TaxID=2060095 RepID=UPI0028A0FA6C|nr:hypothetical protein [Aminipila sp.]